MAFPNNPSNGMIFEAYPGIYYQYSTATKSWFRVTSPSIPLATTQNDGLMSAADYRKLSGLIIPPPNIALSFEDCDTVYTKGLLKLEGDTEGIISVKVSDQNLHENTAAIDLAIDIEKLAQKLFSLGKLRFVASQGPQGDQGEIGDPGANALPVGPQGKDGKAGANAPWSGILAEEAFNVAQQNRAIVDITTERVSEDENYIVVTRGNIGNPEACPDTVLPQDVQSPWIVAFSAGPNSVVVTEVRSPLTGKVCGWACNSDLYYFDIEVIVQSIHTHFLEYLNKVKLAKEQLALRWLNAMIELFNEQKSALCCALEACRSRTRNVQTRQYIETQRIQAALGNFQLIIGADEDKQFPPLNEKGECAWNIAPTNYNLLHLSDPDCQVNWVELCSDDSATGWGPAHVYSVGEGLPFSHDAEVIAVIPSNLDAVRAASGTYTGGQKRETAELIQWTWSKAGWILVIWYCKTDKSYAARMFESGEEHNGEWTMGANDNVTSCYQAGQIIKITDVGPGTAFELEGSGALKAGRASVRIL